jgi:hypothetical protein
MLYDPEEHRKEEKKEKWNFLTESTLYERWMRIKKGILMRLHIDRARTRSRERELEAAH